MRKIIHIDMDAFFSSVEQQQNKQYQGQAVIVGGSEYSRGVVSTCSYPAREFGIHSGMPIKVAKSLCPKGIFLPVNMPLYQQISEKVFHIFKQYSDVYEPMSIDEAYLDVTHIDFVQKNGAKTYAQMIKNTIKEQLNLTATAGVSYNKSLAKLASGMNKPDGLTVIRPEQALLLLSELKVEQFYGVGEKLKKRLNQHKLFYGKDLMECSDQKITHIIGKNGLFLKNLALGIDERPVKPGPPRKSIGQEHTFAKDIYDMALLQEQMDQLINQVTVLLENKKKVYQSISIKWKTKRFESHTRQKTFSDYFHSQDHSFLRWQAQKLLTTNVNALLGIRLLGLSVGHLMSETQQEQLYFSFYQA